MRLEDSVQYSHQSASQPKYRPDPRKWVCTCLHFLRSHFLICKHLVQSVQSVQFSFFLEVSHNCTTPFWSHPLLVPLDFDLATKPVTDRIVTSVTNTELGPKTVMDVDSEDDNMEDDCHS